MPVDVTARFSLGKNRNIGEMQTVLCVCGAHVPNQTRGVKIYQEVILQPRSRRLHHSRLEGVDPSRLTVLPKNTSQLVQDDQRSINPCPHHPSYDILLYHISSDYHRTLDLSSRELDDDQTNIGIRKHVDYSRCK